MKKFFNKKYRFACIYSAMFIVFTIYLLLDTFWISRTYKTVKSNEVSIENREEGIYTPNTYVDDNISIRIDPYRAYNTNLYVADIVLKDAKYLKTAFAKNTYGKNMIDKTSTIAYQQNAILAINGDYYGVQEKGYVLKNGKIYREKADPSREDLVIDKSGKFQIVKESKKSLAELKQNGAYHVLSFGPGLLINKNIAVSNASKMQIETTKHPRTAIGWIDDLHYVFVTSDGRTKDSEGLTLPELASFMKELKVDTAYNLDGGGSSAMYFHQMLINHPSYYDGDKIEERWVSDIVYIGY